MAVTTQLPNEKRGTVTTLVMTPLRGLGTGARIECTTCPARLVVRGFTAHQLGRLLVAVQGAHQCFAKC